MNKKLFTVCHLMLVMILSACGTGSGKSVGNDAQVFPEESRGLISPESVPIFPGLKTVISLAAQFNSGDSSIQTGPSVTADGRYMFIASGNSLNVYEIAGENTSLIRKVASIVNGDSQNVTAVVPNSIDGKYYAYTGSNHGWVNRYEFDSNNDQLNYIDHMHDGDNTREINSMTISPDGKHLFVAGIVRADASWCSGSACKFGVDDWLNIWSYQINDDGSLSNGKYYTLKKNTDVTFADYCSFGEGHYKIMGMSMSPDGKYLYAGRGGCNDSGIDVLSVNSDGSLNWLNTAPSQNGLLLGLAVSEDGRTLFTSSQATTIDAYYIGPTARDINYNYSTSVSSWNSGLAYAASTQILFGGGYDKTFTMYDISGKLLGNFPSIVDVYRYYTNGMLFKLMASINPSTGKNYLSDNFIYDPVEQKYLNIDYSNFYNLLSKTPNIESLTANVNESSLVYQDISPDIISTNTLNNDSDIVQNISTAPISITEDSTVSSTTTQGWDVGGSVTYTYGTELEKVGIEIFGSYSSSTSNTTTKSTSITYSSPSQIVMVPPHSYAIVISKLQKVSVSGEYDIEGKLPYDTSVDLSTNPDENLEITVPVNSALLAQKAKEAGLYDIDTSDYIKLSDTKTEKPSLLIKGKGKLEAEIGTKLDVAIQIYSQSGTPISSKKILLAPKIKVNRKNEQ